MFKLILICISGYLYDILGRKWVIFTAFLVFGVVTIFMPWTVPDIWALQITAVIAQICCEPLQLSPIIQDYVDPDNLARGQALYVLGMQFGIICSLTIIVNLQKTLGYDFSYGIAGCCSLFFCLFTLCVVIEPPDRKKKNQPNNEIEEAGDQSKDKPSFWAEVCRLTKLICKAMSFNKQLLVGYFLFLYQQMMVSIIVVYI